MTSEPTSAFVWIWLPGATESVVCGRLDDDAGRMSFAYGRSYLERSDAVALYEPELPLRAGVQFAASGDRLPLCIDDAMPDSWGRRLVNHRLGQPNSEFGELTYLLESGSDRIGALDFQHGARNYAARHADHPTLDDLAVAAARVEDGQPIDEQLAAALAEMAPRSAGPDRRRFCPMTDGRSSPSSRRRLTCSRSCRASTWRWNSPSERGSTPHRSG